MPDNKLHIVSFDVPYPPDYGGATDVFYKIAALSGAGCSIYLHCFEYGRGQRKELDQFCSEVHYYPRSPLKALTAIQLPYLVASRQSKKLVANLAGIDAPILFEGVHTTACLAHPLLQKRFKAIRVHNVEHDYFRQLAIAEPNTVKRTIYNVEAARLKRYEQRLQNAQLFTALSAEDHVYFKQLYPTASHLFIPPFHAKNHIIIKAGTGDYALYHGNLSHPENIQAALFLINEVSQYLNMPLVIAGKQPAQLIKDACAGKSNCRLTGDPGMDEMAELISNAQVNVLVTFQTSGVKLKLMSALFAGRHIVVNRNMLYGTSLPADVCRVADDAQQLVSAINELKNVPFTEGNIEKRALALSAYNNDANARRLMDALF